MGARAAQLRTFKGFLCSVIVEPVLAGLEAINDRVARGGVVPRRMLAWRSIAEPNVTAFGASAQMQPPSIRRLAFNATVPVGFAFKLIPSGSLFMLAPFLALFIQQTSSRSVPLKRSMEFRAFRDHTHCMTSAFLNYLAGQLRKGRSAACGRSIQQILTLVAARFEAGKYPSQVEAESELRKLVNEAILKIENNSPA
jgi:hypothetical protein